MRHPCDTYKAWQPGYAKYNEWPQKDKEARRTQAVIEMVSEAGEVLGVVQKARRKEIEIPRDKIVDELGDTLWGLVGVMNAFNISWSELCDYNMNKLTERNKNK